MSRGRSWDERIVPDVEHQYSSFCVRAQTVPRLCALAQNTVRPSTRHSCRSALVVPASILLVRRATAMLARVSPNPLPRFLTCSRGRCTSGARVVLVANVTVVAETSNAAVSSSAIPVGNQSDTSPSPIVADTATGALPAPSRYPDLGQFTRSGSPGRGADRLWAAGQPATRDHRWDIGEPLDLRRHRPVQRAECGPSGARSHREPQRADGRRAGVRRTRRRSRGAHVWDR